MFLFTQEIILNLLLSFLFCLKAHTHSHTHLSSLSDPVTADTFDLSNQWTSGTDSTASWVEHPLRTQSRSASSSERDRRMWTFFVFFHTKCCCYKQQTSKCQRNTCCRDNRMVRVYTLTTQVQTAEEQRLTAEELKTKPENACLMNA